MAKDPTSIARSARVGGVVSYVSGAGSPVVSLGGFRLKYSFSQKFTVSASARP